ncbi:UPF0481 protein At3g47200-like [Juglans microcarpa x Juglans regia]|uniref:UPF0481 protein At3g47200-like n=1 Tax=Juglans microcarpa x Juglans regia TaxID=2249226 RepID=UPI001B7F1FEB|nr:UPF0481 protein At3g47200-like [Juglans microcarpa x Juglans regia]
MMLLDGCFIVELLRFYEKNREGEPLFKTRWTRTNISRDLLLLENQLPMFVLQKIFELTTFKGQANLITLGLRYIEPLRPGRHKFAARLLNMDADGNYIHLLDLFHSALTSGDTLGDNHVYSQQPVKNEKKETRDLMLPGKGWVHNAKTLGYAGVKFETNSGSILDIKLKGKTIKIPTITIDDST